MPHLALSPVLCIQRLSDRRIMITSIYLQVRRVKSRMVRLSTRVETLKEVLQKYLDDDADMKDLNLSAKCAQTAEDRIKDDSPMS